MKLFDENVAKHLKNGFVFQQGFQTNVFTHEKMIYKNVSNKTKRCHVNTQNMFLFRKSFQLKRRHHAKRFF